MKRYIWLILVLATAIPIYAQKSNRKERLAIQQGNELYLKGNYQKALESYKGALNANPGSPEAIFNIGLTQINLARNEKDTTKQKELMQAGATNFTTVAQMKGRALPLASRALYNLGNMEFDAQNYAGAIQYYKSSLRIDPEDNNCRRNLRIAQLKQQQNQGGGGNDNKNQDKNKDKDKDKDKQQDRDKQQNQDKQNQQDQNQNQDKNKDQQQKNNQPQDGGISQQTADQILKAMQNKENATRARLNGKDQQKAARNNRSRKQW